MARLDDIRSELSSERIESYWKEGFVGPLTAFDEQEALSMVPKYFEVRDRMEGWTNTSQLLKSQLVSTWVSDVVRAPRILDAVECILGPTIFAWGATFFAKQPSNSSHVGWHQDLMYWGLQPPDGVLTVWLALTDASEDNGAMQVIAGSHLEGFRTHDNEPDETNMLMSDQHVELTGNDQSKRATVELQPGQFSMHHSMLLHGSGPNNSDRPRIGLSINYIAADVIQLKNLGQDSATLVRGTDYFGNFEHEPKPDSDFSSKAIENYRKFITMPSGISTIDDLTDSVVNFSNIK